VLLIRKLLYVAVSCKKVENILQLKHYNTSFNKIQLVEKLKQDRVENFEYKMRGGIVFSNSEKLTVT
jgi:hypothetical protein